ncbi:MAG: bacillithiol biosynthesis deacetylase BshB1 [Pseudarcicella sp.]|nr:bacillithiol biosynthesis deacetylase BshB1 [Pseudarcicella sp.]MBP6410310.1 bacillithiol biosynthesis deacetylase BshB1 [Pseudarcicella sp.]
MKLDLLVFAAHPDDAEISCSGTIASYIHQGKKVGIIDLTKGELGTRGTVAIRESESVAATKILGIHVRENLGLRDGYITNDESSQLKIIQKIRQYSPKIVLANALDDRHPDHVNGALLVKDAFFKSGLRMINTFDENGKPQEAYRPQNLFHYIQDRYLKPDFIIDITDFWELKEASIRAFRSQFFDPNSTEPNSYISSPDFLDFLKARASEFGHNIGVKYGEGFQSEKKIGLRNLDDLV